jgi:large subunit ribosomal protein L7e
MPAAAPKTTVPSQNDVLLPETLLKKRKTDQKAREEKLAKAGELRKVRVQAGSMEG